MAANCDSAEAGGGPPTVTVHVRCTDGSKISVRTALDSTVGAFKAVVAGSSDVPAEQQRLIYKGRILKDDQTLVSYGVESDHTIHLVRAAAPSATSANTAAGNQGASATSNSNSASGFGGSLFPGMSVNGDAGSGTASLFGTGIPELDQMQQQLAQNPNIMTEIMNMPAIQNIINNPDIIQNLFMNNPQLREIIDRNPDLAHVLNDPSTLRQTMEAARNPELMREMMRNTDRAMSNIESSPEGFNMLRRMYETVQEPFLNATTMGGDLGGDAGSNPFAALLGSQAAAQGRERSINSTTGSEPTTGSAPNTDPLPNPWGTNTGGPQPVNTSSNPASTPGAPVLNGLGSLDLENMVGRMQDSSLLSQVLQNPAMMQMMQNLLSDPQYVNQVLNFNPNVRSLLESNGMLNNTGLEFLMNMFGGLGTGGLGVPPTSNVPAEELYATQLSQLQEMGFFDTQENIRALTATAGNVHAAVERLLGNPGQ
ncbi:hypothetical protein C4D60_Mb05t06800 [Musa balbisiana]|uniref:Ubiquitin-like domain-containing protein n=1 Tax=Musa balbisiana TaxID=52838 RepID=A0A4S8JU78_MUSBA|nr:hypothetical protein C4D60_Mb05t06800 [Musa balbisiana]